MKSITEVENEIQKKLEMKMPLHHLHHTNISGTAYVFEAEIFRTF